ncbi:MAG TPA: hypothetical protein VGD92_12760 [Sphingobacteriaceae bacterium]
MALIVAIAGCARQKDLTAVPAFANRPEVTPVRVRLNEASGIADCTKDPNSLWVIEDSGNPPDLLLLRKDGSSVKRFPLRGATSTDWEEMTLVDGTIYIADTGDNFRRRKECRIYRFPEPDPAADTIVNYQTIRFAYPDKPHDAEAFLVDPETKDIFIITKRDHRSIVYKLAYPYHDTHTDTLVRIMKLPYNGVTGAAISRDGKEILVRTYGEVYHYQRRDNQSIDEALSGRPRQLRHRMEPQGESVAFAHDRSGYYTLSEKGLSRSVRLFFYRRH